MNPSTDCNSSLETTQSLAPQSVAPQEGSLDHILDVLASHDHPFILIGPAAQRWMGSNGTMTDICEVLIKTNAVHTIASDLAATRKWEVHASERRTSHSHDPISMCDADLVLRRVHIENANEFYYLALWSEESYHVNVSKCATVEVPDVYAWQPILVEETWHPALHRENNNNNWWFGPRVHPDTSVPNSPPTAHAPRIFFPGLPRGRSATHTRPILVLSLPTYIDALIHHATHYKISKPGLWFVSNWQLRNLTRYLYLELDHQQLPLLIELEEYESMEKYLERFVRKPRFVYGRDGRGEFRAVRVREWERESYPEWCFYNAE
jgi:hypothetical protein